MTVYIVGFKVHSNTAVFADRESAERVAAWLADDPDWAGIEIREMEVQDDWTVGRDQVKAQREARGR